MRKSLWCAVPFAASLCLVVSSCAQMTSPTERPSILLQVALNGGVVNNADLAIKIAELIVANSYGQAELERQKPLRVRDNIDSWFIEGSYNIDRTQAGDGPIVVLINKKDGKIVDIYLDSPR